MSIDTKTALLNAAEAAARRAGFDGFSYADLARDVGIRKASIHYHFPSKADLSLAMMERYHAAFRAICTEIDGEHALAGERLNALIERYRAALGGGDQLCLCVAFSISRDALPADTAKQMTQFRAMMLAWIETVFALAQSDGSITGVQGPKGEAAAVLSQLEGAQLTARVAQDVALFDAATQMLRDRIRP